MAETTTTSISDEAQLTFWESIAFALNTIADDKPDTFNGVKAILDAYGDPKDVSSKTADTAFFAGSGGDALLSDALMTAGWRFAGSKAGYHYAMTHPATGESLTYTEGDVERGLGSFGSPAAPSGRGTFTLRLRIGAEAVRTAADAAHALRRAAGLLEEYGFRDAGQSETLLDQNGTPIGAMGLTA